MPMAEPSITPLHDGPYLVRGEVEIVDPEGNEFKVTAKTVALCRCGASATKPFCDGTHVRMGFKSRTSAKSAGEGSGASL
jgi:CDGSH-type Zn-finger protein